MFVGGRTEDVHSVMVMTGDPSPYMLPLASLTVRSTELFVVLSSMFLVFCTPWQINMSAGIVDSYAFFRNINYVTASLDVFHTAFTIIQLFLSVKKSMNRAIADFEAKATQRHTQTNKHTHTSL